MMDHEELSPGQFVIHIRRGMCEVIFRSDADPNSYRCRFEDDEGQDVFIWCERPNLHPVEDWNQKVWRPKGGRWIFMCLRATSAGSNPAPVEANDNARPSKANHPNQRT